MEEVARAAGTLFFSEPNLLNLSQAFRFKPRVAIIVSPLKSRSFSLTVEGGAARWVRGLEPWVGRGGKSLNLYRSRQGLTPTRGVREGRKPRPRLRFGLVWNVSFPPASGIVTHRPHLITCRVNIVKGRKFNSPLHLCRVSCRQGGVLRRGADLGRFQA